MEEAEPIIAFSGLRYGYIEAGKRHEILHGIDGCINRGERVTLLGRSGSGKSSLLNLVAGLAQPDSGRIEVAGEDLTRLDERARTLLRRRRIGFIYQFLNLIDTLSVLDNVMLPLELDGRADAAGWEHARELLAIVGLDARREAHPGDLSGGEQQRVALVRALVHAPDLVLADEPTGNLDTQTGGVVLELLDRLVTEAGHTLLLVTHNPEVAARTERVLRLHDGHLEALA